MFHAIEVNAQLVQERIERDVASAVQRSRDRAPAPTIRQAIGHRIIQIGARVAAEPSLESVRSR